MMWLLAQVVEVTNEAAGGGLSPGDMSPAGPGDTAGDVAGGASGGMYAGAPQDFAELMRAMPAVWTALLAIALLIGLFLWALGGRLAMKGVMLSGFVLGGLAAMGVATAMTTEGRGVWVLLVGMVGAITGVLLAWLLFRLWMGVSAGLLLAAVVPLAAMVWQGNGPQLSMIVNSQSAALRALGAGESDPAAAALREQDGRGAGASPGLRGRLEAASTLRGDGGELEPFDRQGFIDAMVTVWRQQVEEAKAWWVRLEPGPKRVLVSGSVIGGVLGLLLGLVLPYTAAALQSALAGSVLIFFAGRGLVLAYLPESVNALPGTWRGVLLSVGLITLLGLLVQWTFRKRKVDD